MKVSHESLVLEDMFFVKSAYRYIFLSFNNIGRCNNGIMHFLDSLCNECLFTSERCPDPVVDNRQSVTLYACH